jgi:hypothetical protein
MRNLLLFLLLCTGFSCGGEENQPGYNCENGQCTATFQNPTYLTLQDCQSDCGTSGNTNPIQPKTGTVKISLSWTLTSYAGSITSGSSVLGLGYTSTDVANGAYFVQRTYTIPDTFTQSNLTVGIYYYKAVRSFNSNDGSGPVSRKVEKSGAFTIEAGKATTVSVNLNQ